MIQASGAVVETRIAPDLPTIEADQIKIEQAVFNLLDNALKYGGKSDPRVLIEVDYTPVEVILKVKDNGPGIPLSDQPHIFERFYRVHKDRSADAGGIGPCRSVLKLTAQSRVGTGQLQ